MIPILFIMLNFLFYLIVVAIGVLAGQQVAQESGQKELAAEQHGRQGDEEVRRVGDQTFRNAVGQCVELIHADTDNGDEAYQDHDASQEPEDVHRLFAEVGEEPWEKQIKVTIDKAVQTKLALAVLSG